MNPSRWIRSIVFASGLVAAISSPGQAEEAAASSATSVVSAPPTLLSSDKKSGRALELSIAVNGRRIDDRWVKSNTAGPELELVGEHRFGETLSANLVVGTVLKTGTASSLFTTEGQPSSYVYMSEASLTYQPIDPLAFRGGVLETKFSTNQSIFASRGFPGLSESGKVGGDRFNVSLTATQTMPTASGLSRNYVDSDKQAYLLLHTLGLNAGQKDDLLSAGASLTHYMFGDLPANAAQDSRFVGNSVVGLGASAARFRYEFQGFEASTILRSRISKSLKLELKTAALRNQEAPDGKNLGYNATLVPIITAGNVEIKPEIGYFYNESDTLPATYTSTGVGSNNREGFLAGLKAKFKKQDLTISGRWVEANEIAENPYTADRTIITFGLETSYDIL